MAGIEVLIHDQNGTDIVWIGRPADGGAHHLKDMFDALRVVDVDVRHVIVARRASLLEGELPISVMV